MSKESQESKNEALGGCLVLLTLTPVAIMVQAWAIRTIWAWFIVPEFGAKPLSFIGAYGISTFAGLISYKGGFTSKGKTMEEILGAFVGSAFVYPLMTVGIAWLVLRLAGVQ